MSSNYLKVKYKDSLLELLRTLSKHTGSDYIIE